MLRAKRETEERVRALDRIREWVRARFELAEDCVILVSELACGLPGCPPLETVVVFWTGTDIRHQFKLFKQVEAVVPEDLPPRWMKRALVAPEGAVPECC